MILVTFYFAPSDAYLRGAIRGEPTVYPKRIQRAIVPDGSYIDRLVAQMSAYCLKHGVQYGGCEHRYAPTLEDAFELWAQEDRKRKAQILRLTQPMWLCPYCEDLTRVIPANRCQSCRHFLTPKDVENGIQLPKE